MRFPRALYHHLLRVKGLGLRALVRRTGGHRERGAGGEYARNGREEKTHAEGGRREGAPVAHDSHSFRRAQPKPPCPACVCERSRKFIR